MQVVATSVAGRICVCDLRECITVNPTVNVSATYYEHQDREFGEVLWRLNTVFVLVTRQMS